MNYQTPCAVSYGAVGHTPRVPHRIPALRLGVPDGPSTMIGTGTGASPASGNALRLPARHQVRAGPDQQLAQALPRADRHPHRAIDAGPLEPGRAPRRRSGRRRRADQPGSRLRSGACRPATVGSLGRTTPSRQRTIAASDCRRRGSTSTRATQPGADAMRSAARICQLRSDHPPARPAWATPTRARPDRAARRAPGEHDAPSALRNANNPGGSQVIPAAGPQRAHRTWPGRAWRPASQHDGGSW